MIRIFQGIDIVEVAKIRKVVLKNRAFIGEVFTEKEREYCQSHKDQYLHFAGRFAAKEACMKALGVGLDPAGPGSLRDIEVVNQPSGMPDLHLGGWLARMSRKKRIIQKTVSISHSGDYAVASVILLGEMV